MRICKSSRVFAALLALVLPHSASAQSVNELILRSTATEVAAAAARHGLTIVQADDRNGIYRVTSPQDVDFVKSDVVDDDSVIAVEGNATVGLPETPAGAGELSQSTAAILETLPNRTIVSYYNNSVWTGYASQPATMLVRAADARAYATGVGVVAVIDTGIDASHPALAGAVVQGYDFIANTAGYASDLSVLSQSTAAILEGSPQTGTFTSALLNQSTAAILEQSTAAILESSAVPAAFGHGTMVAGLIRLIAPTARIMPLRVFSGDGTATTYDIVRAIYWAVDHGATVINMSFSLTSASPELVRALNYANQRRVVAIASAGNAGRETLLFPAALRNVIGVASTTNVDTRSAFSNYGAALVRVAAPGEALITTYPGGQYAAAWGTSFSAALVSGGAALLLQVNPLMEPNKVDESLTKAKRIDGLGEGRIDLLSAVKYAAK